MQLHYCIATRKEYLGRAFDASPAYDYAPNYNVICNLFVPAITGKNRAAIVELKWGYPWPEQPVPSLSFFIPLEKILAHWNQPKHIRSNLLKAVRETRCAVLANCFVVWRGSIPHCVYLRDRRLFTFGAVWNESSSHAGFSLLTQPANDLLRQLGQTQMPFILGERHFHDWINPNSSVALISQLMKQVYPASKMNAYPIGPAVNDPNQNSAAIYRPMGEKLSPDIDFRAREKLDRQGWGRK